MTPKGWNSRSTSSSDCCLFSIPTNSFRSPVGGDTTLDKSSLESLGGFLPGGPSSSARAKEVPAGAALSLSHVPARSHLHAFAHAVPLPPHVWNVLPSILQGVCTTAPTSQDRWFLPPVVSESPHIVPGLGTTLPGLGLCGSICHLDSTGSEEPLHPHRAQQSSLPNLAGALEGVGNQCLLNE